MMEGLDVNQNLRWECFAVSTVGIDISKGKSMVTVCRPLNRIEAKPFEVCHASSELK